MIKIVVGGAIEKKKVAESITMCGGDRVEVKIMSDIEAAMQVKTGKANYYFGACATGGGGALAMAITLLGASKCSTVSMPGNPPEESHVDEMVKQGKVAFGFTSDHIEKAVPFILNSIFKKEE
ncbi:MAG: hypothetical protein K0R09_3145 [Clostridiales bacterium]|nr:hypothetical protein [Clostridiales bacterium]